jgi:hypothetical protein
MKANRKYTKTVAGKRYTDYDKQDLANLAAARACLDANSGRERSQFTPEEADRRVAFYAAQVLAAGCITQWLAPATPKPRARYRNRFVFGDALGRHLLAHIA